MTPALQTETPKSARHVRPTMHYGGKLERRATGVPVAELVGFEAARVLAKGGWRSVRHFLLADAGDVALRCHLPEADVRRWQEASGLRRVPGLGPRGVECLVAAGVLTPALLAASEPDALTRRLGDRLGASAPPATQVRKWVIAARALGTP